MIFRAYAEGQRDLRWVTVTLSTIALLLLLARLSSTWKNRGWLGLEDVFVIFSTIWLIIFAAMVYTSTTYGFGKHIVDIQATGGSVPHAMKFFWLTQVFYTLTNGFNKMAFLALYYRVFAIKPFRKACMVLMVISIGWTFSYVIVAIFQCTPIHKTWNMKTVEGKCINFFWHRWSNAILNLVTDLAIFFLPMPVITHLKMSIGNRIGLVVLFSMGFFICLITTLRMATLPLTLKATEPTWESAPTNLWSFVEAAVGVICACLISLRKTVSKMWPQKWRSSKGASAYGRYGGGYGGVGSGQMSGRVVGKHGVAEMYPLGDLKKDAKGKTETHVKSHTVSRSESQERMIEGFGITVTKDVEVVRQ